MTDFETYATGSAPAAPGMYAPGIMSGIHHQHSRPAFSPDGNEVYWSVWTRPGEGVETILFMRRTNARWSSPQVAPFSGLFLDHGPVFTHDGRGLIFATRRPLDACRGSGCEDERVTRLWRVTRTGDGWGVPSLLPLPQPERERTMPTIAQDGTLYFFDVERTPEGRFLGEICYSRLVHSEYQNPVPLPESINLPGVLNWTPFIAPDESYLLFSSHRPGGSPNGDIYVAERLPNSTWSAPKHLGSPINTNDQERFPAISRDGRTLWFVRGSDMVWTATFKVPALSKP